MITIYTILKATRANQVLWWMGCSSQHWKAFWMGSWREYLKYFIAICKQMHVERVFADWYTSCNVCYSPLLTQQRYIYVSTHFLLYHLFFIYIREAMLWAKLSPKLCHHYRYPVYIYLWLLDFVSGTCIKYILYCNYTSLLHTKLINAANRHCERASAKHCNATKGNHNAM